MHDPDLDKYLNTLELLNNLSGIVRYYRNSLLTLCSDGTARGWLPDEDSVVYKEDDIHHAVVSLRTEMSPMEGWPCGSSSSLEQGLKLGAGEGSQAAGARSRQLTPRALISAAELPQGTSQCLCFWRRLFWFWCCCFYC